MTCRFQAASLTWTFQVLQFLAFPHWLHFSALEIHLGQHSFEVQDRFKGLVYCTRAVAKAAIEMTEIRLVVSQMCPALAALTSSVGA